MPEYRYVSQGEYYITTDPNTVLVTSGMTECIAIVFISKNSPEKRLLSHLDGYILYNPTIALSNLSVIKSAFEKTNPQEFEVHLFGGSKNRRNYSTLLPLLKKLNLDTTSCIDTQELCAKHNLNLNSKQAYFTPTNITATVICHPNKPPVFTPYEKHHFNLPFSEEALEEGQGLDSNEKQNQYRNFLNINKMILNDPGPSRIIRTSADIQWIEAHQWVLKPAPSNGVP